MRRLLPNSYELARPSGDPRLAALAVCRPATIHHSIIPHELPNSTSLIKLC